MSKLLERVVARQLVAYLDTNHLLPDTQSGFRRGFSTDTAIIRVLSDLPDAVDRDEFAALILLDLSAAFDTVDHDILLDRLRVTFGVHNSALSWFRSYLAGRRQHVRCGGTHSAPIDIVCGVPQGSVLGPILFIIYTTPPTWSRSLHHMVYRYMNSPMIANCTVPVGPQPHRRYRLLSHSVSTASQVGCAPIASNLMLRRLR